MAPFNSLLLPQLLLLATLSASPALSYLDPSLADARVQQGTMERSAYGTYIVAVVEPPSSNAGEAEHHRWHESFLPSWRTNTGEPRLLHSYTEAFSGFAAKLTKAELDAMAKKPGFIRAFPDRTLQLMTTHTPEFLGLRNGTGFWSDAGYGKGVIIGLLDTGIYAAHPSFSDHGISPPPARWKGSCKAAHCNNKLIGVTSFVGVDSHDQDGHGTHTSSTAAGNFVSGASFHGLGSGIASGIAPGAHIAMYKVCKAGDCEESAILAGIDAAIKDGVDVLSISLADSGNIFDDYKNAISIGSFSAVSKGIVVVCAAGNSGSTRSSVKNDAPWQLTVAAGSVDRSFGAGVHLGNGRSVQGEALTQFPKKPSSRSYPLHYDEKRPDCKYEDVSHLAGKILVCENSFTQEQEAEIHHIMGAGAAGMVLYNDMVIQYSTILRFYNTSVVQMTAHDGGVITSYARERAAANGSAALVYYNNTLIGVRPAPIVAWFSSRGPSATASGVLKPDILAPGLNILAAWTPNADSAPAATPFKVSSGTSMATPHVSGVAALVKSIHPSWSPSAIKSAILTTADTVSNDGEQILDERHEKASPYTKGVGHVNPVRAADPGLVYDISTTEYAGFICSILGDEGLAIIVHDSRLTCAKLPKINEVQLNYPTITVPLKPTPFTVNRTVTNVGPATATYTAKVVVPKSMAVHVSPETLTFTKVGERKTFNVSVVSGKHDEKQFFLEGSLSWVSGKHVVRSPIVALSGMSI